MQPKLLATLTSASALSRRIFPDEIATHSITSNYLRHSYSMTV